MNTKKILSLVLALAMIVTVVPSFSLVASADVGEEIEVNGTRYRIVGENLVTNGGFEDGLTGWNSVGANNVIQTLGGGEQSTEQVYSGTYAFKQVTGGGGTSGNNLFRHIPLNSGEPAGEGKTYILSLWRYGNGGGNITMTVGLTNNTDTVQVDESCGGLGNSDQSAVSCNLSGLPTNEWHQLSYVLTASATSAYAEIYARWCGNQFFDDITLYEIEEITPNATATVNYVAGEDVIAAAVQTVDGLYSGDSFTPAISDTYYADEDSATLYEVGEAPTVTLSEGNNTVNIELTPYKTLVQQADGSYNLVVNGGLETGDFTGWTTRGGNAVDTSRFSISEDSSEGQYAISTANAHSGSDGETIKNTVTAPAAASYYAAVDVKGTTGWKNTQYMWIAHNGTYVNTQNVAMNADTYTTYALTIDGVATGDTISLEGEWFQDFHPLIDNFVVYQLTDFVDTVDTIESPADITVISGNAPLLPEALAAKGVLGSNMTVDVEWNTTNIDFLTPGTKIVPGTAAGKAVSVDVTVLPETFALEDMSLSSATITQSFPTDITEAFTIEFDYTPSNVQNNWIYISNDNALWGAGQVGMGTNNDTSGVFYFQPVSSNNYTVRAGNTHRIVLTIDPTTCTYSGTMRDIDGNVVLTASNNDFRTDSNTINSIVISTNGGAYPFELSNIKVYAPSIEDQFAEYTVTVTGSVTDVAPYTERAVSAEDVAIPYYQGNILKERTVDNRNITLTYAASEETLGTWAIRNNTPASTYLTDMKYLGSHDSFADKAEAKVDDGGALYGNTGASSPDDEGVIRVSQAQSSDALEQLNAGVRYFDVRLSRQNDGSFWTFHGPAFENFRDVATTIAQFAAENPGEVIILDIQALFDALYETPVTDVQDDPYNGNKAGDSNAQAYAALVELLDETGVLDYSPGAVQSSWDRTYGEITANGTKTAILIITNARGANNQPTVFINRNNHTSRNDTYTEDSDYNSVVEYLNSTYSGISTGAKFGIIHAYTTTNPVSGYLGWGSLIEDAQDTNPNWINETTFADWMRQGNGDALLLNDVTSHASVYLAKLSEFNRDGFDGTYTNTVSGVTIEGPTAAVPFSTTAAVTAKDTEDGTDYTFTLTQFSSTSATFNGVSLTFPAEASDASAKTLVIKNGAVIGMADGGSNVTVENQTVTSGDVYSVIAVSAPTLTAELGWDEYYQRFAIDFVTGNVDFTTGYTYGVDFYAGSADAFVGDATVTAENPYAGISTDKTNLVYAARPWVQITGQADKILGTPVYTSIYKLVTEDIEASGYTADSNFNPDRTAAAVEVIRDGGMFADDNGTLTDEMLNIVTDNGDGTYTLIDSAQAVGIRFTDGEGSYSETIRVEGSTVTLVDPVLVASVAEELFVLEEVELVYVPELVEESVVNEQVEIDLDFEEIL